MPELVQLASMRTDRFRLCWTMVSKNAISWWTKSQARTLTALAKLIAQEMDRGFFSKVGAEQRSAETDSATMELLKQLVRQHPELLTELLREANGERK